MLEFVRHSYLGTAGGDAAQHVRIHVDADTTPIPLSLAIPCGLIINELTSNALKHAFRSGTGDLWVEFRVIAENHRLVVRDNGVGMTPEDMERSNSLGLKIVRALVTQLDGHLQIDAAGGTRFTIEYVPAAALKPGTTEP